MADHILNIIPISLWKSPRRYLAQHPTSQHHESTTNNVKTLRLKMLRSQHIMPTCCWMSQVSMHNTISIRTLHSMCTGASTHLVTPQATGALTGKVSPVKCTCWSIGGPAHQCNRVSMWPCVGVLDASALVQPCVCVSEHWSVGVLECWCDCVTMWPFVGTLEWPCVCVLEHWSVGVSVCLCDCVTMWPFVGMLEWPCCVRTLKVLKCQCVGVTVWPCDLLLEHWWPYVCVTHNMVTPMFQKKVT